MGGIKRGERKEMSYSLIGIYLLFLVFVLFLSGSRYEKKLLLIPASILAFFVGFRGAVSGYDYLVYKYFYNLGYRENPYGYEIFFVWLRDIFKFLGGDFNLFTLALGIFFVLGTYWIFISYSENPGLCFLIYLSTFFFWHNFNILRNFIAIIVFYFSLKFILRKEFWKYMAGIVIATNFHKTALILFPFYFLLRQRLKLKIMGILTVISLLANPLSDLIFKLNIGFLGISERIGRYIGIREMGNRQEFLEVAFLVGILAAVQVYDDRKGLKMDEKENMMFNLTFYSFLFFILFYRYAIMLRVMEYFRFAGIIMTVYVINRIPNRNWRYITLIALCLYMTVRYYNSILDYGMANYITWLFQ